MDDPINPLEETAPAGEGSLSELPTPEPLQAPLSEAERAGEGTVTPIASHNGHQASPAGVHDVGAALRAREAAQAAQAGYGAQPPAPQVIGQVTHLGAMQHDLEQLHAEATSTRRAVQLLALSIGAVAALILVYSLRARIGAGAGQVKGGAAS